MPVISIQAQDGHGFSAYRADPSTTAKGCIVVVQEIFGVTEHIKNVCEHYARQGYIAVAPALFDRHQRDLVLPYNQEGLTIGSSVAREKIPFTDALQDIQATIDTLNQEGKVGLLGFCYGGSLLWAASAMLENFECASSYYGGNIAGLLNLEPKTPIELHFGEHDHFIPPEDVEKIRTTFTSLNIFMYPADHGFDCIPRPEYDKTSAALAQRRTLALFKKYLD